MLGGWGWGAKEEELVSPQTHRVISTFRGSPSKGAALWEFDLSESVWSHEMWGQTQAMGKGTNGRTITGLQTEFHFKRGQMAFSSPLKVTWCTKDRRCVDWQMLEDRVNAILHKSMRPKQKDNKAEIKCESKSSRTCLRFPWDRRHCSY